MKLETNQQIAFDKAKARLSAFKWYTGVCMDNFPSEDKCTNDMECAVNSIFDETAQWDAC